ncbi:MAG: hypothetical protein ABGZ23_23990 [Fuerstiella sp.]|nr:hypothetical protein [Fuerstiella sp.]
MILSKRALPNLLAVLVGSIAVVVQSQTSFASTLELQVVDDNDTPIPCRVLILKRNGNSVVPDNHTALSIGLRGCDSHTPAQFT